MMRPTVKPLVRQLLMTALLAAAAPFLAAPTTGPATSPAPAHRVVLYSVVHDVDYTQLEPERLFVVLAVAPDPAAHIAYLQSVVPAAKAADDRGNSLIRTPPLPLITSDRLSRVLTPIDTSDMPDPRLIAVVLQVPPLTVELGRTIKMIEGEIPAAIPAKVESTSVLIPGTSSHTFAGNLSATFTARADRSGSYSIGCTFDLPRIASEADRRMWIDRIALLQPRLRGHTGKWTNLAFDPTLEGNRIYRDIDLVRAPAPPGTAPSPASTPPTSADLDLIVETKSTTIPFHFENLPLP
jgi:hypothetical protein